VAKGARATITFRAALLGATLAGVVASAVAALSGAASASPAEARPILFPCVVPQATGPAHAGLIGDSQNGTTICVPVGERLLVSLAAPAGAGMAWQHVVASPPGVLVVAPMPVTPARAVTSAAFLARDEGRATLTSQRRACPTAAAGSASCQALVSWKVTVEVRGTQRNLPLPHPVAPRPLPAG
jgi:hypothetical protein